MNNKLDEKTLKKNYILKITDFIIEFVYDKRYKHYGFIDNYLSLIPKHILFSFKKDNLEYELQRYIKETIEERKQRLKSVKLRKRLCCKDYIIECLSFEIEMLKSLHDYLFNNNNHERKQRTKEKRR